MGALLDAKAHLVKAEEFLAAAEVDWARSMYLAAKEIVAS